MPPKPALAETDKLFAETKSFPQYGATKDLGHPLDANQSIIIKYDGGMGTTYPSHSSFQLSAGRTTKDQLMLVCLLAVFTVLIYECLKNVGGKADIFNEHKYNEIDNPNTSHSM